MVDLFELPPNVHAAKGVVLQHAPGARALYVGDGAWEVYADLVGDAPALGHGESIALAWIDACVAIESVMGASL